MKIKALNDLVQMAWRKRIRVQLRIYPKELELELAGKVFTIPRTEKGQAEYKQAIEALQNKLKKP
jgi:hypothetical protein